MNQLDERLREIVSELEGYHYHEGNSRRDMVKPNTVEKIKQALLDEGWLDKGGQLDLIREERIYNQKHWIAQWQKEIDRMEAAKRVSGVSEPTEPKVVINKYEGHK